MWPMEQFQSIYRTKTNLSVKVQSLYRGKTHISLKSYFVILNELPRGILDPQEAMMSLQAHNLKVHAFIGLA